MKAVAEHSGAVCYFLQGDKTLLLSQCGTIFNHDRLHEASSARVS